MTCWTRLVRFEHQGKAVYGQVESSDLDIGKAADAGTLKARLLHVPPEGIFSEGVRVADQEVLVENLLAPLGPQDVTDFKCVGLNYKKHIEEAGRTLPPFPSIFLKPLTSHCDYGEDVPIPPHCHGEADYEGELAIVIGRTCKNVPKEQVFDVIAGYACANDMSSRKWQRDPAKAGNVPQWCYSKGFDKYAPFGPAIVSKELIPDPSKLILETRVNGEVRQHASTSDFCFDVATMVSFISQGTTLRAGTLILTGTPGGVGYRRDPPIFLQSGDKVEVEIQPHIGTLRHGIVFEH